MKKKILLIVEETENNEILIGSEPNTSNIDIQKAVFTIFQYTQTKYPKVYNEILNYISELNKENAVLIEEYIKANANNKIN